MNINQRYNPFETLLHYLTQLLSQNKNQKELSFYWEIFPDNKRTLEELICGFKILIQNYNRDRLKSIILQYKQFWDGFSHVEALSNFTPQDLVILFTGIHYDMYRCRRFINFRKTTDFATNSFVATMNILRRIFKTKIPWHIGVTTTLLTHLVSY